MRTLTNVELDGVAGGLCVPDGCPTRPFGEWEPIVLTGFWARYWMTYGATVDTAPWEYMPWGSGGGGGEEIDPVDNTPGYPVEHQKGLGISDYQEAWQKVLSKMSAAELTAFSVALAKAAADAKDMKEKGASDRLAQLAAAVLVGDSIGAAFASNQASDNLRGKSMALFEGLITKAYAAAAALPGGI